MKDSGLKMGALLAITLMAVIALGFNVSAVRYESVESYETLLEGQADLIQSFEKLLKGIPADQELTGPDYLRFLNSFKDLKDRQLDQTERFVTLVEQSYATIKDDQRAELALSEKNLLTQLEEIQGSYEGVLKYGFRYIVDIKDKGSYVDDFEKELHREQALLSRFESLLNKKEFQNPGIAGSELPERRIFKQLLGLFEQDIRLMDGLIRSFNMLQNMENGEVPAYLTIKKELEKNPDTGALRYKYTVTNAAGGVDLKDVEVTDSSLGLINTSNGDEKFSLIAGATEVLFSKDQHFDCITCQGCVCRWCNFAIAMGYQVTDNKVVYNLSNYVCHSSSVVPPEVPQTLHGTLQKESLCCEYTLLTDNGAPTCWLIADPNSKAGAKLDQIWDYCSQAGITPLIEVTGTYYASYKNDCGWTGPALIVEDVHYAVEIVKSADRSVVKVGDIVNYKATVHNYWNQRFKPLGPVVDFDCNNDAIFQDTIGEIAPESELSLPTWQLPYNAQGDYCDFVRVTGEVEVSGGTKEIISESNKVTVTVTQDTVPMQFPFYFADGRDPVGSVYRVESLTAPGTPIYTRPAEQLYSFAFHPANPEELYFVNANDDRVFRVVETSPGTWGPEEEVLSWNTYIRDLALRIDEGVLKGYFSEATGADGNGMIYEVVPEGGDSSPSPFYEVQLPTVNGFWAGDFAFDDAGNLYLSSGNHIPARIYKVTMSGGLPTGDPVEIYRNDREPIAGMVVKDNSIYYANWGDKVYCLNLATLSRSVYTDSSRGWISDVGFRNAAPPAAPTHVEMKFRHDYLDLLTGEMRTDTGGSPPTEPWTLKIDYNATSTPHSVVFQNQAASVEIAHLVGKAFDETTDADVVGAPWTTDLINKPFDSTRVILVRQSSRIFKLGNPVEHDPDSVEFDYEELPS